MPAPGCVFCCGSLFDLVIMCCYLVPSIGVMSGSLDTCGPRDWARQTQFLEGNTDVDMYVYSYTKTLNDVLTEGKITVASVKTAMYLPII